MIACGIRSLQQKKKFLKNDMIVCFAIDTWFRCLLVWASVWSIVKIALLIGFDGDRAAIA